MPYLSLGGSEDLTPVFCSVATHGPRGSRSNLISVLALYTLGLAWGYVRLPWASVTDFDAHVYVAQQPAVSLSYQNVSRVQLRYLEHALTPRVSSVPVLPVVKIDVTWNALVFARVKSGYVTGPVGAEIKDRLFVCVFGAWIPVHTYSHLMS
jgi:hypothetical protein